MKTQFFKTIFFINFFVIEYLALTPQNIEVLEGLWDKSNHFFAFFVLYILLGLAYSNLKIWQKVFLLVLLGFQIEIFQYFIPGRFFSLLDVVADSIGIFIGFCIDEARKKFLTSYML